MHLAGREQRYRSPPARRRTPCRAPRRPRSPSPGCPRRCLARGARIREPDEFRRERADVPALRHRHDELRVLLRRLVEVERAQVDLVGRGLALIRARWRRSSCAGPSRRPAPRSCAFDSRRSPSPRAHVGAVAIEHRALPLRDLTPVCPVTLTVSSKAPLVLLKCTAGPQGDASTSITRAPVSAPVYSSTVLRCCSCVSTVVPAPPPTRGSGSAPAPSHRRQAAADRARACAQFTAAPALLEARTRRASGDQASRVLADADFPVRAVGREIGP
jgi:hypothetical protein